MDDVLKRRATSFGQVADEYARGRPGYPAEAIDWVLESAPGGRVVDLGAGTGKLTRALVAPGRTVTAIEPLDEMRERLAADLPEVTTLAGSAESMPVADASADAVFVAQAFHWFDPVPALNEIARVLAAGGMLGLIWNTRDDSEPWVAEFSRILSLPVEAASAWDWSDGRPVSQHPEFRDYRERRVPNLEPYTPQRLLEWARSTSSIAILEPADREQRLAELAEMCRTHPDLRDRDTFPLPMVTMTIRATRE